MIIYYFLRKKGIQVLRVQVYIDDITFGGTNKAMGAKFVKLVGSEFQMSMMGELNFFLGFQIHQDRLVLPFINRSTSRN